MGLFDFLKKKTTPTDGVKQAESVPADSKKVRLPKDGQKIAPSVPEKEKKYYLPDDYYTYIIHEGTAFERRVVTFEERKKTCIPSEGPVCRRDPATLLLLEGKVSSSEGRLSGLLVVQVRNP